MNKKFTTKPAHIAPAVHTVRFSADEMGAIVLAHMRSVGPVPEGCAAFWVDEECGSNLPVFILQITETPDA